MPEPLPVEFLNHWKPIVEAHLSTFESEGVDVFKPNDSWSLIVDGFNWMNTNDHDLLDHKAILDFEGEIIITGLGLGLAVAYALHNPKIHSITVVENDERVIQSVGAMLANYYVKDRHKVRIIVADADTVPLTTYYHHAFLDHHQEAIPEYVIERYREFCGEVITWWDEYGKWV